MKGRLDSHQLEIYKIALLEMICIHHGIAREKMDSIADTIREDDK